MIADPGASHAGRRPPAYRLPDDTRVGPVHLRVADLDRSRHFYERILGLTATLASPTEASLTVQDGEPLVWLHAVPGSRPAPRRGRFGLYHFALLLPDRASLGRFIAHASQRVPLGTADHWVSEAVYLTDPDGLGVEVYADRPRHIWQRQGDELAMGTDPLDVEDLIRASAGIAWTEAPAGTTMGHLHLHVGDLEQASQFYHRLLGFDAVVWRYPGALFLSAGGYHHHLGTNTWSPGPAPNDDEARLLEWTLRLPSASDGRAAAAHLLAGGADVAEAPDGSWLTADPWGTRLRLSAR